MVVRPRIPKAISIRQLSPLLGSLSFLADFESRIRPRARATAVTRADIDLSRSARLCCGFDRAFDMSLTAAGSMLRVSRRASTERSANGGIQLSVEAVVRLYFGDDRGSPRTDREGGAEP
jgi:hypothetical protein